MIHLTGVLPIAFSGARGAYSEEAARRFFGRQIATLTCGSAVAAGEALVSGRAGNAVVAVENTITGPYEGVLEALTDERVFVTGELVLPIRHCLLGVPGTRLQDVRTVVSHPSALAHCREWLGRWGVAARAASDTAQAAHEIAETRDATLAVLGSRLLAEVYGLVILAEGLTDDPHNDTRFWVLSRQLAEIEQGTRSVLLVGPAGAPRTWKTLRIQLEARGASRARAPLFPDAGGTRHLVEFDHRPGEGPTVAAEACRDLPFRFAGTWRAERSGGRTPRAPR